MIHDQALGGLTCLLTFLLKVCVHRPWLPSYSMISRISRALVSSARPEALTSLASTIPSCVEGQFDLTAASDFAGGRWCDGLVFVTSRSRLSESDPDRRPVPRHPGQVVELPPKAFPMRPSPPQTRQVSMNVDYCLTVAAATRIVRPRFPNLCVWALHVSLLGSVLS